MKKIISLITAFTAAFFLLIGCSAIQQQYVLDSAKIGIECNELRSQYKVVENILRVKQEETQMFSDTEWITLIEVDASMDMIIDRFESITKFNTSSLNISDVEFFWRLAGNNYVEGRTVILSCWNKLDPDSQNLLIDFDNRAEEISDEINLLLDNPDNKNINDTVVLISKVVKLTIKMLGVIAI